VHLVAWPLLLALSAEGELPQRVQAAADRERSENGIPAILVAVANGDAVTAIVSGTTVPAHALLRAGHLTELVTALATRRLGEQRVLGLDTPIGRLVPELGPSHAGLTPRQLAEHRSGLPLHPSAGSALSAEPLPLPLPELVASLRDAPALFRAGSRQKTSQAGYAVLGLALERAAGEPYPALVKRLVLAPLGMGGSGFAATAEQPAKGAIWTYDGRDIPATPAQVGPAPAVGLLASIEDLGRLAARLAREKTLEGPARGRRFDGRAWLGQSGSFQGFTTTLRALPGSGLAVVVVATRGSATAVTDSLADLALRLLLAGRGERPPPAPRHGTPVGAALARRLAGRWSSNGAWAELRARGGELVAAFSGDGRPLRLRRHGRGLRVDDLQAQGPAVEPRGDRLVIGGRAYRRTAELLKETLDSGRAGLLGEYGWPHQTAIVLEREGALEVLADWVSFLRLEDDGRGGFQVVSHDPSWDGERISFVRDGSGRARELVLGGVRLPRRKEAEGAVFRIAPARPVSELISEARAATPPAEEGEFLPSDLVELTKLDPTIHLDIRYAGSDNFLGTPVYQEARAFLQRSAAEAVARAGRALAAHGYGLLVHDGYRPWYVTKVFWDATPAEGKIFVADPDKGSRHNRGCAVDLTLYERSSGRPVAMTGLYDEMSPRSFPDYPGGTSAQRALRELLRSAMEAEGFTVYESEWWHFDYRDWKRYRIENRTFAELR